MAPRFFKALPESETPVTWPQTAEGGEPAFALFVLDRAADPDGSGSGFDWYGALGDEAAITAWADDQTVEEMPVGALPNPLSHYPSELASFLPTPHLPPDYQAFWDALLVSPIYQEIRAQALGSPAVLVACTEFIAAFGDAKNGRPNVPAIQACINNLLTAGTFSLQELEALGQLLAVGHLDNLFVLSPSL
jgi:hypothetical protein